MYHRFEENKYPSTNIRVKDFVKQIEMIKNENIYFINPKNFLSDLKEKKKIRKLLITIDDGFLSFYNNAWPILKKNKIPFILFVSTREVGNYGYMNWEQIQEISNYPFVEIGNHSHTHEYLVDEELAVIKKDLLTSKELFKKKLKKNSIFFSYPFGEYSLKFKTLVEELDFKFAFGQHSGVVGNSSNSYELPRFPINEKYGELKRFATLLKTIPFSYLSIQPEEKYINDTSNPPKVKIKFSKKTENLRSINCFSNEEDKWQNSQINFLKNNEIEIKLSGKFITERGRINCSLRQENGFYKWLGVQFVIAEK